MSIVSLVEQVKHEDIVLPAIQRDFVWSEAKIEKLFDSIMRGYPIGIVFLWETYSDIRYRTFEKDYRAEAPLTFHDSREKRRLRLVLDGQQRLLCVDPSLSPACLSQTGRSQPMRCLNSVRAPMEEMPSN